MEGIRAAVRYPGIRIGAFRRTFGELEESLLAELAEIGFARALGAKWTGGKYNLTFGNRSIMMFRYAETIVDATRRQGGQYQLLLFDERTLTPPDVCSFLESRLRSGKEEIPVLGTRSGTNPGGIGHGEVKRRFIDSTDKGLNVITDKRGRTVRFIPSRLSDNPHVNAEYARDLDALPDAMRAAFRDGSWDAFSGQVFCYDNRVEILTGSGWKPVAAVEVGELIATLAPSGEMTFAPATRVWRFQFDGDMYVHEGRALNFSVTPGHRMWTRGHRSTGDFQFVPVDQLPGTSVHLRAAAHWHGADQATVTITAPGGEQEAADLEPAPAGHCQACAKPVAIPRKGMCDACYRAWNRAGRPADLTEFRRSRAHPILGRAKVKSYTFATDDWCELLGWYLSEGFTMTASSGSRYAGHLTGFGIAQVASPEKIARIAALLDRMALRFTFDGRRFRVSSSVLAAYFQQFGHHADKFIPRDVLALARTALGRLFESLMAGDGHRLRDSGGWIYVSTSAQLADDVQELCVRLNLVATITDLPGRKPGHAPHHRVSIYKQGHDRSILRTSSIQREHYAGEVACVTVEPHHTVLVRRGGKAMWSGNTEWSDDRHVVPRFALPPSWQRYNGIDYGWSAPWVVLWGARDEDGRVWLYREITDTLVTEKDQARRILAAEAKGEDIVCRSADPAMWARTGEALSVADQYAAEGVWLTPAGNDRLTGKQRMHSYLAEGPACRHHRALGWDTCPMLHVLAGTCPEFVRTMPTLPYDPRRPEDVDTHAADHQYDAGRYLLMAIGGGPSFYMEPEPDPNAPPELVGAPEVTAQPFGNLIALLPYADGSMPDVGLDTDLDDDEDKPRRGATATWPPT